MNYEYPPVGGGGSVVARGLAEAMVRLGHRVDVVTSGMADLPKFEVVGGVAVHRTRCWRRVRHYTSIAEMATQLLPARNVARELLAQRSYAINHTHFVFPSGVASYWLWRKTGLPYVVTVHGSDVPGYNPDRFRLAHVLLQPAWRTIIRNAKCVISASRYLKDLVESRVDVEVTLMPHGIDLPRLPDRPKLNRILAVTRVFERKGLQFLLRALDGFESDWEVVIAGDGPYLPTLKELAKEISFPVQFLGFVQGDALWDLYQSAKVFVFPSIQENSPVVLLEAMNAGCAVITTTADGCAEMAGEAAIKVRPGSPEELRAALERLTRNGAEAEQLAALGRERVSQWSSAGVAAAHQELFTQFGRN